MSHRSLGTSSERNGTQTAAWRFDLLTSVLQAASFATLDESRSRPARSLGTNLPAGIGHAFAQRLCDMGVDTIWSPESSYTQAAGAPRAAWAGGASSTTTRTAVKSRRRFRYGGRPAPSSSSLPQLCYLRPGPSCACFVRRACDDDTNPRRSIRPCLSTII